MALTCRATIWGLLLAAGLWLAGEAWGQTAPGTYPPPAPRTGPDQPVQPQLPALERRSPYQPQPGAPPRVALQPMERVGPQPAGAPAGPPAAYPAATGQPPPGPVPLGQPAPPPQAPFELTPQQQAEIDRVLRLWEQRSASVKTFESRFKRWEWDPVFGPKDAPRFEDLGIIKYAAPDRGVFEVTETVQNGKTAPIETNRAEKWICDGKAIFEYKGGESKTVVEYPLPPQLQGKAIANSPLPFLFGSKADDLKRRYWVRAVTPTDLQGQQTWIEAYPRFQQDAANFYRAILVLSNQNMQPYSMKVFATNMKNHTSYQFFEIVINDPMRFFKGDPFHASVPFGWKKVIQQPAAAQASRPAPPGNR